MFTGALQVFPSCTQPKFKTDGISPRQAIHKRLANVYHAVVAYTCYYIVLGMHLGLQRCP